MFRSVPSLKVSQIYDICIAVRALVMAEAHIAIDRVVTSLVG